LSRKWSQGYNLIIICLLVFFFNTSFFPIISTHEEVLETPSISENSQDIEVIIESPTNVLSGTVEDLNIIMTKKNQGNIVIKGIDLSYINTYNDVIYKTRTTYDFTLQDRYEETIHLRIPETYQLEKIAETDIPLECTFVVYYEADGVDDCLYTSVHMRVYDRFLENENTERRSNNEPAAIT